MQIMRIILSLWTATALLGLAAPNAQQARGTTVLGPTEADSVVGLVAEPPESIPVKSTLTIGAPKPGTIFNAPAEIAIECTAVDPKGDIRLIEFFANGSSIGRSEHLTKDAVIPGRPRFHSFVWKEVAAGTYRLSAKAQDTAGETVESAAVEVVVEPVLGMMLVKRHATWSFNAENKNLGTDWRALEFDHSTWPTGPAQLGFGDGDESTVVPDTTPRQSTVYFRHVFDVPSTDGIRKLLVRILRDDGVIAYLNGKELLRDNLPAGEIRFETTALQAVGGEEEDTFLNFSVEPFLLVPGKNVLAVEVHQASLQSSDLSFALELIAIDREDPSVPVVRIRSTVPQTKEPCPPETICTAEVIAPGQFLITRTPPFEGNLPVFLKVGGTATPEADYRPLARFVVIPDGKEGVELSVVALADALKEGDETVEVQLLPGQPDDLPLMLPVRDYRVDPVQGLDKVVIQDNPPGLPAEPLLRMTSPKSETAFRVGTTIPIKVLTVDPAGYFSHLDYYSGDIKIGESDIVFVQAPPPGTVVEHEFNWSGAGVGQHVLTTRGKDTKGNVVVSPKVPVAVIPDLPVVSIEATQAETTEPSPTTKVRPGVFLVKRSGPTQEAARIFLEFSGTAAPGKDYAEIPRIVQIPAGKDSAEILVAALDDDLAEADESVIATVVDSPLSSAPPYRPDPQSHEAKVVIHDNGLHAADAVVTITSPRDGAEFKNPASIEFTALTYDPRGAITHLDWFAGNAKIGQSDIVFIRPPDPGTSLTHSFTWTNPPEGEFKVAAVGTDARGEPVVSKTVRLDVKRTGPDPDRIMIEIIASDASAAEKGEDGAPDPAVFKLRRSEGRKDVALKINLEITGTARNGIDYEFVSESIELPAGEESVPIVIKPVPDKAIEGDEMVLVRVLPSICPAIFPAPPWCYLVGKQESARAVVRDDAPPVNQPPKVSITKPRSGTVFTEGEAIAIAAEASDSDGQIERLDILSGDRLLGSTKESKLALEWKEAAIGQHTLTARAVDNQGAESVSSRVLILVRPVPEVPFVTRDLPSSYTPGVAFEVSLTVEPPPRGAAHTVEDMPPKGWEVSNISHAGAWDSVNSKVKFGPFTDRTARKLTYQVKPPQNAETRARFEGSSSLDGKSYPIVGDQVTELNGNNHPADRSPANFVLKSDEVTAYAAAWKNGTTWPKGPNPIPATYVTRAGRLWLDGEHYVYDRTKGEPPNCWVIPPAARPALGLLSEDSPRAIRTVVRSEDGSALIVRLDLLRIGPGAAVALEESVAKGWRASDVSHDGLFDADSGAIRWGLFVGELPGTLTYRLTSKPGSRWLHFSGILSVDGASDTILGPDLSTWSEFGPHLKVKSHGREAGRVRLKLSGPPSQLVRIEASANLVEWREIDLRFVDEEGQLDLDEPEELAGIRFYRIRVIEE